VAPDLAGEAVAPRDADDPGAALVHPGDVGHAVAVEVADQLHLPVGRRGREGGGGEGVPGGRRRQARDEAVVALGGEAGHDAVFEPLRPGQGGAGRAGGASGREQAGEVVQVKRPDHRHPLKTSMRSPDSAGDRRSNTPRPAARGRGFPIHAPCSSACKPLRRHTGSGFCDPRAGRARWRKRARQAGCARNAARDGRAGAGGAGDRFLAGRSEVRCSRRVARADSDERLNVTPRQGR
jgi:hypothetical protein